MGLGCSINVLSNVSQMPRGVESFAIGKQNPVEVRRVVPHVRASRRPVRGPLSPPTEGTHFVPTYAEICPNRASGLPPNQPAIDRDDRSGHIIGQVSSKELDRNPRPSRAAEGRPVRPDPGCSECCLE
jgi:hypothetical protein